MFDWLPTWDESGDYDGLKPGDFVTRLALGLVLALLAAALVSGFAEDVKLPERPEMQAIEYRD